MSVEFRFRDNSDTLFCKRNIEFKDFNEETE